MKVSGRLFVDTNAVIAYVECSHLVRALIDDAIAIRYATMCLQLKKMGRPIPESDIRVATTCLELGVPLLTREDRFDHS